MNKLLLLVLMLLSSCSLMPPSKSMEEFKARLEAGLLHGFVMKDDAPWQMQVGRAKRLPEKSAKPLNYAAIDRLMRKHSERLGYASEINRRYNQGQITKAQWQQEMAAHDQAKANAEQEKLIRSAAISQSLMAASASMNQATAAQNQAVYNQPSFQPMPMVINPVPVQPMTQNRFRVVDSNGNASTVTVY